MGRLLVFFYGFQLISYLKVYLALKPANFDDFEDEVFKIVNFNMLKPENLVRIFYKDFTLEEWLYGKTSSYDSLASVLQFFILGFAILVVFVFFLLFLYIIRPLRNISITLFTKLRKKIFWNYILQSWMMALMSLLNSLSIRYILYNGYKEN